MSEAKHIIALLEVDADPSLKLNPDFFNDKNKLNPDIRKVMLEVEKEVLKQLKEKDVEFEPYGLILTGSLVSVNYDADSDVDFHVLVDFTQFPDAKLTRNFLTFFAKDFNKKFNLKGRNLELYFQNKDEPHVSPGIYDIKNDTWLMPPSGEKIERTKEMEMAADNHKKKVQEFDKQFSKLDLKNKSALNDFLSMLTNYFDKIRAMRKDGIAQGGLASVGNQVFKLLRRNGTLEMLTKLMNKVQDQIFEA